MFILAFSCWPRTGSNQISINRSINKQTVVCWCQNSTRPPRNKKIILVASNAILVFCWLENIYSFFNKIELSFLLESFLFYPVHHPPQFEVWSCFVFLLICASLWVADAIQIFMKHFFLPGLIARWHFPVSLVVKCSYVIDV